MAATCDAFPQGWDLQVTGVCFPTCGVLSVALLDADQQQLGDALA